MRLEQMVTLFVGDTRPVVRDAQVGPSVSALARRGLDAAAVADGIDRVVQEVRDDLAHEKWVCAYVDHVGSLADCELDLFCARAGTRHTHGATHELIEVNWTGCELDAWSRAL